MSTFRIVGQVTSPFSGTTVTKVGITTGRTEGKVLETGVDVVWLPSDVPNPFGRTVIFENQIIANLRVDHGDSGSPVIRAKAPDPPGNPVDTYLQGIWWAWSGPITLPAVLDPQRGKVYESMISPIENIEADLGPLEVSPSFPHPGGPFSCDGLTVLACCISRCERNAILQPVPPVPSELPSCVDLCNLENPPPEP